MKTMKKLLRFATISGFIGAEAAKTKNPGMLAFRYTTFDIKTVRTSLGRHKKHTSNGMFIYVLSKTQIVRVDTVKRVVILGDGAAAFKAIYNSI